MTNLAGLARGERAIVRAIHGADEVCVRLMEMGLTPGCQVTLLGAAPLGDPLEFEIRGYHLSLRKAEAARVECELDDKVTR